MSFTCKLFFRKNFLFLHKTFLLIFQVTKIMESVSLSRSNQKSFEVFFSQKFANIGEKVKQRKKKFLGKNFLKSFLWGKKNSEHFCSKKMVQKILHFQKKHQLWEPIRIQNIHRIKKIQTKRLFCIFLYFLRSYFLW